MMGGISVPNHDLQKAVQLIDKARFFRLWRARRVLESDSASGVDTGVTFVKLKESALYRYVSALIWILKNDDHAWSNDLAEAQNSAGYSDELEAITLYEHAMLLVRHGWRVDIASKYLRQVVALSGSKKKRVRRARALTTWGESLYGQKLYKEAYEKLNEAERVWTAIRSQPGHLGNAEERRWMLDTSFWLLKTLIAQNADEKAIKEIAKKIFRYDRRASRKAFAANALRPVRETKNA